MKRTGKIVIPLVTGLSLVAVTTNALAQKNEIKAPPVSQELPSLLNAEVTDWLKRGDFTTALSKCSLEVKLAPLVSEPGALAEPYMCLGEALYGLKQYPESAEAFSKAVEQLEVSVGVFDPRLAMPLEGLGKALMEMGQLEAAEAALTQAKDITHRNFGIYNLVQSSVVNRLTKAYFDRSEWAEATREQKFLLRANEEEYGETPQLLPALRRLSKFQESVGRPDLARVGYRRALDIMIRAYGPDDLRLTGPLRDFAKTYTNTPRGSGRIMSGAGAKALREIVSLYQRQDFSDAADTARAWSELGDWYVIGGSRRLARKAYLEAGKVLAGASEKGELFSEPVEIEFEEKPIFLRRSKLKSFPNDVAILEFEFTVTAAGRVARLTVIRDDLDYAKFAFEVGQNVKQSRYRPRIVDGIPVDTPGVRKEFRYDFSDSPIEPEKDSGEEVEEKVTPEQSSGEEVEEKITPEQSSGEEVEEKATPEQGSGEKVEERSTLEHGPSEDVVPESSSTTSQQER